MEEITHASHYTVRAKKDFSALLFPRTRDGGKKINEQNINPNDGKQMKTSGSGFLLITCSSTCFSMPGTRSKRSREGQKEGNHGTHTGQDLVKRVREKKCCKLLGL